MLDIPNIYHGGNRVRPDHQEFADGMKLLALAVVSAVLTATLVIGAGQSLLSRGESSVVETPVLTRASLR